MPFYKRLGTDTYYPLKNEGLADNEIQAIESASRSLLFDESGDPQYQYGDLYLDSLLRVAWGYSIQSFGGGELGTTTYYLIKGAETLHFPFDQTIAEAVDMVKCFAEVPPQPVIITFPTEQLDLVQLKRDDGSQLPPDGSCQHYRYLAPIDLAHHPLYSLVPEGIDPYFYSETQLQAFLKPIGG